MRLERYDDEERSARRELRAWLFLGATLLFELGIFLPFINSRIIP